MTPKEFKIELTKVANEIGSAAQLSAHISERHLADHVIYCGVYPRGMDHGNKGYFSVEADDFETILLKVRAKWAEYAAEFRTQTLRKMALAIIRITSEIGQCTDASLRQDFSADEVKRFGAEACGEANAMAGKGPFEIVTLGGANGAPADVEGARVQ